MTRPFRGAALKPPPLVRIYVLLDPRDLYTHFVGHTKLSLQQCKHLHCDIYEASTPKDAWIIGLKKLGLAPLISEIDKVYPYEDMTELEAEKIAGYIAKGFLLFNPYKPGLPVALKRKFTADEMVALCEGSRIHLSKPPTRKG